MFRSRVSNRRLKVSAAEGHIKVLVKRHKLCVTSGPGIVPGPFHPLTSSQRARHDMGTLTTPAISATAPRTIVADPDETPESPASSRAASWYGQTVRTNTRTFEIQFIGPSPASPGDILTGTGSVVVHVPATTEGDFNYQIQHIPKEGASTTTGPFVVRSCTDC